MVHQWVKHMDEGDARITTRSNLRAVPERFLAVPPLALKLLLMDKPPSVDLGGEAWHKKLFRLQEVKLNFPGWYTQKYLEGKTLGGFRGNHESGDASQVSTASRIQPS